MKLNITLTATALALACGLSNAVTLRVANVGDVQSMDPHSLNEIAAAQLHRQHLRGAGRRAART